MLTLSMSGSIVVVLLTKAAEDHLMMHAFFLMIGYRYVRGNMRDAT